MLLLDSVIAHSARESHSDACLLVQVVHPEHPGLGGNYARRQTNAVTGSIISIPRDGKHQQGLLAMDVATVTAGTFEMPKKQFEVIGLFGS